MLVGYARVSTLDQNLDLQIDALQAAGCERTFTDRTSGARADRPGLREALTFARGGDVLAVWKCDRLSRSLAHLIETVQELERRGIGFRSLAECIDTGSAGGKIVFPIFAATGQRREELDPGTHESGLSRCATTRTGWRSSEAADCWKNGGGNEAPRQWHSAS
jgi:DNA invertase Pin-like site-specific DNA recombinase